MNFLTILRKNTYSFFKAYLIFIFIIFLSSLFACTSIRKNIVSLSEQDLKNAETTRTLAKNLLLTWKLNSGFIKGALGDRINQLPLQVIKAMEELDSLAGKQNLEDFDLGYSLGLRIRLLSDLVVDALKLYAPEVLKYLPLIL